MVSEGAGNGVCKWGRYAGALEYIVCHRTYTQSTPLPPLFSGWKYRTIPFHDFGTSNIPSDWSSLDLLLGASAANLHF